MENEWPIDTSTLKKGDEIPAELCAQILQQTTVDEDGAVIKLPLEPGTTKYQLALLRLKEMLCDRMAERGLRVTIQQKGSGLRILTDSEAALYRDRWFDNHVDGLRRAYEGQAHVEIANLTDAEKQIHETALMRNGRQLQAIMKARKTMEIKTPAQAIVPRMFPAEWAE